MGAVRWHDKFPEDRSTRQCKIGSLKKLQFSRKKLAFLLFLGGLVRCPYVLAFQIKKWRRKRMVEAVNHNGGGAMAR